MDDARTLSPPTIVAGAFDAFGNARAAVEDLLTSGFAPDGVSITSNPANPDGVPGSFFAEIVSLPGICRRFFVSLIGRERIRQHDPVRRGGVVVAIPVAAETERVLARNILQLNRGLAVEYAGPGAPLY